MTGQFVVVAEGLGEHLIHFSKILMLAAFHAETCLYKRSLDDQITAEMI
jgi:hypothetical protein